MVGLLAVEMADWWVVQSDDESAVMMAGMMDVLKAGWMGGPPVV